MASMKAVVALVATWSLDGEPLSALVLCPPLVLCANSSHQYLGQDEGALAARRALSEIPIARLRHVRDIHGINAGALHDGICDPLQLGISLRLAGNLYPSIFGLFDLTQLLPQPPDSRRNSEDVPSICTDHASDHHDRGQRLAPSGFLFELANLRVCLEEAYYPVRLTLASVDRVGSEDCSQKPDAYPDGIRLVVALAALAAAVAVLAVRLPVPVALGPERVSGEDVLGDEGPVLHLQLELLLRVLALLLLLRFLLLRLQVRVALPNLQLPPEAVEVFQLQEFLLHQSLLLLVLLVELLRYKRHGTRLVYLLDRFIADREPR
mmetsp:Transcript_67162/g.140289  ORF Transcript_67162/g.140289 Transcript_67162/m.140289 type:complete len:322 (-) Transcript_67162:109-1074(-)